MDVVEHIFESTGGYIDLVILTHEHQDHLNGIWKKNDPYFEPFTIGEAWIAWTEDPENDVANELRRRHKDQLLSLLEARRQLALAVGDADESVVRLDALLGLELGDDAVALNFGQMAAAAADPEKSVNKQALKLVKDKASANRGFFYMYPGGEPVDLEGSAGIRAYILGPPESAELIGDEDPRDNEAFPRHLAGALGLSFGAAARAESATPFSRQFYVPVADALNQERFFSDHYGSGNAGENEQKNTEVLNNAEWRRIDNDWLFSAETLALKLNSGINNTSLVVAFELPASRKILLFAGDAQRGNWLSWADYIWRDGDKYVDAKDILGRTVLYKVGHHGSHNATLKGETADEHPNLSWMGLGKHSREFTAMITAVNKWAMTRNNPPWVHPLPSIRDALLQKTQGRVFQTDTDMPEKPAVVSQASWGNFLERCTFDDLYFDFIVKDA
jgi:hypothetical protein